MNQGVDMSFRQLAKLAITDFSALPPGVRQTVQLWVVSIILAFHVLWACGWIPGMPGFALDTDISEVKVELRDLTLELRQQRVDYLEERILTAYAEHCRADELSLKQIHQRRLQRLLRLYQDVTGRAYPLQRCAE